MKRKIVVSTPHLKIVATMDTFALTKGEVQKVRDELADELMKVAANLRWMGSPLNQVKVR